MELKAFFMGPEENEPALQKVVDSFKETAKSVAVDPLGKVLSRDEGRLIIGIKTKLRMDWGTEEDKKEFFDALLHRLRVLAVVNGFTPLDDEGHIIWLQPGYGFEVFFHSDKAGRADELYEIAKIVYDELGEHMEDGQVGAIGEDGHGGEFFRVQLFMQDYLRQDARARLMLAAYFRLLLLARQQGFVPFRPGGAPEKTDNSI